MCIDNSLIFVVLVTYPAFVTFFFFLFKFIGDPVSLHIDKGLNK